MKTKIYVVQTSDDHTSDAEPFGSKEAADDAAFCFLRDHLEPDEIEDHAHWTDLDSLVSEGITAAVYEHEVEIPAASMTMEIWDDQTDPDPVDLSITSKRDQLTVDFDTGQKVWIEREAGRVRVHCFEKDQEELTNVELNDHTEANHG